MKTYKKNAFQHFFVIFVLGSSASVLSKRHGLKATGDVAGCDLPDLDEGILIDSKPKVHYDPMASVNVSCKAGYYSSTGRSWETLRCKRSDDGVFGWSYDGTPLVCKEGCFVGNQADYSSTNFNEASPLLHIFEFMRIECAGVLTGWSYYNRLDNRPGLAIFVVILDRIGLHSFRLANYTVVVTTRQRGWNSYVVPSKFRFRVTPGQVVGLAYENWKQESSDLIIPFRYEDATTYPTYLGFLGIVNLDGKSEIKIGRDIFTQAKGRHPAIFSLIEPEAVSDARTTTKTTVTTTTVRTTTTEEDYTDEFTDEATTTTTSTPMTTSAQSTTTTFNVGCGPALMIGNAFIRSKTFVDQSRINDKVLYECLEGFKLEGESSTITTIAHCREDLSWADLPHCLAVKATGCGDIPIVNGAALVHKSFEGARSMQTGDAVYFGCSDRTNYTPFPPGSELVYCKSDGTWTTLPICIPKQQQPQPPPAITGPTCDLIPVIRNGQEVSRNFIHGNANNVAQAGDSIRFGCTEGFKVRQNVDTTNCSSDGQWEPLPICDKFVGKCDSTHLIVTVALPVPLSPTHLFYLRQYLKALPRAWTYLTSTPSTEVLITLIGMDTSGAISTFLHRTPHDPLSKFDSWVDSNVRNWPDRWLASSMTKNSAYDRVKRTVSASPSDDSACGLLGPFCDPVGKAIEASNQDKERPVRLLYISTSPLPLRSSTVGVVSVTNSESLLGVPVDNLKTLLDFESWVYLLSPETFSETEFGDAAPDLKFFPRGLRRLASLAPFFEQMSTSVELHWELIYPGNAFKNFLCSVTTPNVTMSESAHTKPLPILTATLPTQDSVEAPEMDNDQDKDQDQDE